MLSHQQLRDLLQQIRTPGHPSWILMVPNSIGETVIVCALARAFIKEHGSGVTLVIRPEHRAIAEMYPDTFEKVVLLPLEAMREFTTSGFVSPWQFERDVPINTWPQQYGDGRLCKLNELWVTSGGQCGLDLIDLYRHVLRLPWGAELAPPAPNAGHIRIAHQIIETHNVVPYKSVIFFPGSNTNQPAPYAFWSELARQYGKRGCRVYSNSRGAMFLPGAMPVPGTELIDLPLEAVVHVCEFAGTVVAGSTGVVFPMLAHGFQGSLHVVLPEMACRDYVNFVFEECLPMNGCHRLFARDMTLDVDKLSEWLLPAEKGINHLQELARDIVEARPSALCVDAKYLKRLAERHTRY